MADHLPQSEGMRGDPGAGCWIGLPRMPTGLTGGSLSLLAMKVTVK
jgi:hypothetical protein